MGDPVGLVGQPRNRTEPLVRRPLRRPGWLDAARIDLTGVLCDRYEGPVAQHLQFQIVDGDPQDTAHLGQATLAPQGVGAAVVVQVEYLPLRVRADLTLGGIAEVVEVGRLVAEGGDQGRGAGGDGEGDGE